MVIRAIALAMARAVLEFDAERDARLAAHELAAMLNRLAA